MKIPVLVGVIGSLIALPIIIILVILATAKPSELEWQTYVSEEGGFSIDVPGKVEKRLTELPQANSVVEVHGFTTVVSRSRLFEGKAFGGGYFDVPNTEERLSDEALLSLLTKNPLPNRDVELIYEKEIRLGNHVGKEIKFNTSDSPLPARIMGVKRAFIVGERVFEMHVLLFPRLNIFIDLSDEEVDRFFNSFQLIASSQKQDFA